jgi:DNA repair photolyase
VVDKSTTYSPCLVAAFADFCIMIKGRGAQSNINNRFDKLQRVKEHWEGIDEDTEEDGKTEYLFVEPKTILNTVESPDIPASHSINPYQGCEHGCVYCYARNSHEYWGYGAGIDFERKILVKKNAALLLTKELGKKGYRPDVIMFSGNTDCYQPAERKFEVTKSLLEVCLKFGQPVGIISKNTLYLRDLELLRELAAKNLVHVIVSMTTLDESLRRVLEPRTSSSIKKLEAIRTLSENQIPVSVLMAPVIPALNSSEILEIAEKTSAAGALGIGHQVVRLNGWLKDVFTEWAQNYYPDRAQKIIHQIEELHGGKVNDSRFGTRMKGEGVIAKQIADMMKLAKRKYFAGKPKHEYDFSHFNPHAGDPQTRLF